MNRRCLTCPAIIDTGTRCRTCAATSERTRRPPSSIRYDADYRRARTAILATLPTCSIRLEGCTGTATTIDHHPPLSRFPPGQWQGQLRPACAWCNYSTGGRTRARS